MTVPAEYWRSALAMSVHCRQQQHVACTHQPGLRGADSAHQWQAAMLLEGRIELQGPRIMGGQAAALGPKAYLCAAFYFSFRLCGLDAVSLLSPSCQAASSARTESSRPRCPAAASALIASRAASAKQRGRKHMRQCSGDGWAALFLELMGFL